MRAIALHLSVAVAALMSLAPLSAHAQSLSVTLTPPLFQLSLGSGDTWISTLKIVNNNAYDVTYYAQVVDMQANGEDGRSKFIPIVQNGDSNTLGHWITVTQNPIPVKAGQSFDVPFTVSIPQQAEPGGHYAAILVGTEPSLGHATGTMVKVSSFVSSLIFVRIKGDVTESGRIREFYTTQTMYQEPKADFTLRFENTGNVHLHPEGEISIYNMWGKQRGDVLINQDTDFGNVLPQSIRRFNFSWQGDSDPLDIGLYSAAVTLSYGEDAKQNVTAKTYFWVVPLVPITIGLSSLALFILLIIWLIRRYIRRALVLEGLRYGVAPVLPSIPDASAAPQKPSIPQPTAMQTFIEPLREGVIDLRRVATNSQTPAPQWEEESPETVWQLIGKYRLFIVFLGVLIVGGVGTWVYFGSVFTKSRHFQISDVHIQAESQ